MKHLDLFSGIGGFALAAKWAGFETVQFVEKDSFCQKVLKKHWPSVPCHDDIKTFNFNNHITLLTGGFPCQSFSVAGKRKGKEDDRYLWPEMYRIVKECQPDWVVAENVTGIISIALDDILMDLEREDYATRVFILPASAAQAPHKRERVWIIANRDRERCNMWCDSWEERFSQDNIDRNIQTIQSEWPQLKPLAWSTYTAQDWFDANTRLSGKNDGVREKLDRYRIKALGNAIVSQVVYPILKMISMIEDKQHD